MVGCFQPTNQPSMLFLLHSVHITWGWRWLMGAVVVKGKQNTWFMGKFILKYGQKSHRMSWSRCRHMCCVVYYSTVCFLHPTKLYSSVIVLSVSFSLTSIISPDILFRFSTHLFLHISITHHILIFGAAHHSKLQSALWNNLDHSLIWSAV